MIVRQQHFAHAKVGETEFGIESNCLLQFKASFLNLLITDQCRSQQRVRQGRSNVRFCFFFRPTELISVLAGSVSGRLEVESRRNKSWV